MKKRGMADSMLVAIEIVGAALVSFLLITTALRWADSETPYKEYLSKDIGLVIESLMASPGNIKINYSNNASDYIIDIQQDSVAVYTDNKDDGMQSTFIPSHKIKMESVELRNPETIQFLKTNDEIIINEEIQENLDLVYCCEKTGYKKQKINLLVDLKDEENELIYPKLCVIANSFMVNIGNKNFIGNLISTRKLMEKTDDEISQINCMDESYSIPEKKADVILSITTGNYNDDSNNIKAFVLSGSEKEEESKRLACLIINSISKSMITEDLEITGASVVPVNLTTTNYDFPLDLISSYTENQQNFESVFVMIELGNINSDQGKDLIEKMTQIGELIAEGFSDYE